MRGRYLVCLVVSVVLPVACGGRYQQGEGDDGSGAGNSGGSLSQGATSSTGAKPSKAGTANAGGASSVGGSAISSTGGSGMVVGGSVGVGGSCICPDVACGPGYYAVPNPDGCCFHCEPFGMPCPTIACAAGSHLEQLPGQMCPMCVPDSCAEQRKSYEVFKSQLLEKYSSAGCMVNQDCTIWWEKNQCAVGCGVAVPASTLNNLESNLQSYAQQSCSPMCAADVPPCEPFGSTPVCVQGKCLLTR